MTINGRRISRLSSISTEILKKSLIGAILICFFIALSLTLVLQQQTNNSRYKDYGQRKLRDDSSMFKIEPHKEQVNVQHRLGIIVPYRDRYEELSEFVPFINTYLNRRNIEHEIIVVNQTDKYRFNRASLINVGFLYATRASEENTNPCDYIAMHDVDLLPLNNDLPYNYPEQLNSVMHIAAPGLHPIYNYAKFIGGILIIPASVFGLVNGMSNVYWGWGLEDDEFYVRLVQANISILRPEGLNTDKTNTFHHIHSGKIRPRDYAKCFDQVKKTRRRDRMTGLNNVNYTIRSIKQEKIKNVPLVLLNVELHCNFEISPWCDCGPQKKVKKKTLKKSHKS